MSAVLLDGKTLAQKIKNSVRTETEFLLRKPCLAVILVGDNPASAVYVRNKEKDCEECGFTCRNFHLSADTTQEALLQLVTELNQDEKTDGILVQLPLPKQIDEKTILLAIDPFKDVDAFHPYNVGMMMQGNAIFHPCTPAGIIKMLEEYEIPLAGKKCVVLGRSNIVGKPMALLLLEKNATVTICHSKTEDLKKECLEADVLISAVGKVNLITEDMVKKGATVIDVAMNRNETGNLCGDVDFNNVKEIASFITPVPGGVGPMTRAMLMDNTMRACLMHQKVKK